LTTDDEEIEETEAEEPAEVDDQTPGLDELLGVLVQETTLWPLLIVIFLSTGAFGAGLLVLTGVDRNPFAAAALILIAGMSIDLAWRARTRPKLRRIARAIGLFWVASIALAALAVAFGIV
jgi:hypothetical protein